MSKRTRADDLATVAEMMDFFVRDENKAYESHNKRQRLQLTALRAENQTLREEMQVITDHRDGLDNECFRLEGELMEKEYQINEMREMNRRIIDKLNATQRWMDNLKKVNTDMAEILQLALPHVPEGTLPRGTPMLIKTQIPFLASVREVLAAEREEESLETEEEIAEESSDDGSETESEILWEQDFNRRQ